MCQGPRHHGFRLRHLDGILVSLQNKWNDQSLVNQLKSATITSCVYFVETDFSLVKRFQFPVDVYILLCFLLNLNFLGEGY